MDEPLILASASPIRKKLLAAAGLKVRVEPPLVDEEAIKRIFEVNRETAPDCALALAEAKAQEVAGHHQHVLVVGADQILVCGSTWFNKPADLGDARAQLQALRGRTHELFTAVCVVRKAADMAYRKLGEADYAAFQRWVSRCLSRFRTGCGSRICRRLSPRGKRGSALFRHPRRLFCNTWASAARAPQLFAQSRRARLIVSRHYGPRQHEDQWDNAPCWHHGMAGGPFPIARASRFLAR